MPERATPKAYLDKVGIEYVQDKKDGLLILGRFEIYDKYKDITVDINKLFKCIKAIVGHANFTSDIFQNLTDFGNLRYLCSGAFFWFCNAETTGKIESIGMDVDLDCPKHFKRKYLEPRDICYTSFNFVKFKSTGKIKYIGGNVSFEHSEIKEVPELEIVTGNVHIPPYFSELKEDDFASVKVGGKIW